MRCMIIFVACAVTATALRMENFESQEINAIASETTAAPASPLSDAASINESDAGADADASEGSYPSDGPEGEKGEVAATPTPFFKDDRFKWASTEQTPHNDGGLPYVLIDESSLHRRWGRTPEQITQDMKDLYYGSPNQQDSASKRLHADDQSRSGKEVEASSQTNSNDPSGDEVASLASGDEFLPSDGPMDEDLPSASEPRSKPISRSRFKRAQDRIKQLEADDYLRNLEAENRDLKVRVLDMDSHADRLQRQLAEKVNELTETFSRVQELEQLVARGVRTAREREPLMWQRLDCVEYPYLSPLNHEIERQCTRDVMKAWDFEKQFLAFKNFSSFKYIVASKSALIFLSGQYS